MRPSNSVALALLVSALLPLCANAQPAPTYLGAQVLGITGAHRDEDGVQHGAGVGALLEGQYGRGRYAIHIEGIPPVSIPQRASAAYGAATPQLSVFNGAARVTFGRTGDFSAGIGATVINQRTPLPAKQQEVASRLAGARFELHFRRSLRGSRFVEIGFGAAPHLRGSDIYTYSDRVTPDVHKPEVAAEEDAMLAWGVRHANTELLFGLRSINFSAKFTNTGAAADSNNGGGFMLEWRRLLGS